jgi:predicted dithiol-disulfide oxidoreductase (DUF899 family)
VTDESANPGGPAADTTGTPVMPAAVDRTAFEAELDALRVREKAHTREGDAIAAARRRQDSGSWPGRWRFDGATEPTIVSSR